MDKPNHPIYTLFRYIQAPKLNLEATLPEISPLLIFGVLITSYFFILSGSVFDMIRSPPAYGVTQDDYGRRVPEYIQPWQVCAVVVDSSMLDTRS
jgi:hypothetical protein